MQVAEGRGCYAEMLAERGGEMGGRGETEVIGDLLDGHLCVLQQKGRFV